MIADVEGLAAIVGVLVTMVASVVILVLPVGRETRRIDRKERRLCPACGYDLRATPERCPECGVASGMKIPMSGPLDPEALAAPWTGDPLRVRIPDPEEETVTLYETGDKEEAGLLSHQLYARGVMARFQQVPLPGSRRELNREADTWRVLVRMNDWDRAKAIAELFQTIS